MDARRKRSVVPFRVSPMLATLEERPFHRADWIYEEKYDGIRILAYREGAKVSLISRNGKDRTQSFPAIANAIMKLRAEAALLDGEVIVLDKRNVSRFQLLQQGKGEPRFAVFDCLYLNGEDLRKEPLSDRRAKLEYLVKSSSLLSVSARLADNGLRAFEIAKRRQLEGLVAKNLKSVYVEYRSREWLKVRVIRQQEFVIGGFTPPEGAREYFGALLLGVYAKGRLIYVGKVGTGFDQASLASLHRKFLSLAQKSSTFDSLIREKQVTFVAPKLVGQISFTEWTKDGKLRHPVFLGLRDDKSPREVRREEN